MLFRSRPAFAGAFGATVCAVLMMGILSSRDVGGTPAATSPLIAVHPETFPVGENPVAIHPDVASSSYDSNNIARQMFEGFPVPQGQPVNFTPWPR